MRYTNLRLFLFAFTLCSATAQQAFINLDFESAVVPVLPPGQQSGFVPIADALPGWTCSNELFEESSVFHNGFSTGGSSPSLLDSGYVPSFVIDGDFTVGLSAAAHASGGDLSLSQTGLVPATARSILFKAALDRPGASFSLFLGGTELPVFPLQVGPNYVRYGADVSAFAGASEELRFTLRGAPFGQGLNSMLLDTIQFSPVAVPEPGVASILLGGLVVIFAARSRIARGESQKAWD